MEPVEQLDVDGMVKMLDVVWVPVVWVSSGVVLSSPPPPPPPPTKKKFPYEIN